MLVPVGGQTTFFSNLSFYNSSPHVPYVFWNGYRRDIYVDLDGTLSNVTGGAMISPYYPHYNGVSECVHEGEMWDNAVICNSSIQLRRILFGNPVIFADFSGMPIKILNLGPSALNTTITNLTLTNNSQYTEEYMEVYESNDVSYTWAIPFATG